MRNVLTLAISVLLVYSCTPSDKLGKQLNGTWSLHKVYENNDDVTEKHNPSNNRWIEFKSDGTFASGGEPFGDNKGRWNIDQGNATLYIDSDVDDDDSEWRITFSGDETIWTGIGHPRKESTKLVHKRKLN